MKLASYKILKKFNRQFFLLLGCDCFLAGTVNRSNICQKVILLLSFVHFFGANKQKMNMIGWSAFLPANQIALCMIEKTLRKNVLQNVL